jgi:hypothetical protein
LEQKRVIEELAQQLQKLSGRVDSIIDDNKSSTKAILEKATILVPNPEYPKDMFGQPLEASNDDYRRAVTLMQASVRTIEKSFDFLENPFNYLLEVATRSNSVASNCRLSKMQQAALIMSFIPATSPIYRDMGAHTKRRKTKRRKTKRRKTKRQKTKHQKTKHRISKRRKLQNVDTTKRRITNRQLCKNAP